MASLGSWELHKHDSFFVLLRPGTDLCGGTVWLTHFTLVTAADSPVTAADNSFISLLAAQYCSESSSGKFTSRISITDFHQDFHH